MKYRVTFEFEAGQETCASKPGIFCQFLRHKPGSFGLRFICTLFERDHECVEVQDNALGWLTRCAECLKQSEEVK
jgi:hypothetical protein